MGGGRCSPRQNHAVADVVCVYAYGVQANWKLWPLANFISFAFVPLELRVLFGNVVSVGWSVYVSAVTH